MRSRVTALMLLLAMPPLVASQPVETFRVSRSPVADVQQEILQAVNSDSKQTTEVFPGTYLSPLGEAVIKRIESLRGRVDEADRNALSASKAAAGFDRSILAWRANPAGRAVALAVRYFRDALWKLELEMTDDYGRADPVDPARYEFFAIAVCTRGADAWSCREEQLADAAGRYKLPLPQDRTARIAAAERIIEMVVAGK